MNAENYIQVVEKKVVANLANAFLDGPGVFQHDSVPCHKTKR